MADPISWIAAKVGEWVAMSFFQAASGAGLGVSAAATIANAAYAATYGLVFAGAAAGLSSLARPSLPDPGEGTEPTNQTRPEIQMGTGRARLSGPRLLWESIPGWNIEIIALHEGPVDGFETYYLNDDVVTIDGAGWVQPLEGGRYGGQNVRILTRRGAAGEAPFSEITALTAAAGLSDLYGSASHAHGVAKAALLCKAVKDKDVLKIYPNGPPRLSVVTRMSRVYDWRDPDQDLMTPSTWKWTENALVNHVHWEWLLRWLPIRVGAAGWIQGDGRPPPAWCLEIWNREIAPNLGALTAAANVCDEAVALKAGGTEPRYRQGGWWRSMGHHADIRRRFLDCYDGRMCETGSGAFLFGAGRWAEPDYELSDRHMAEAAWVRGAPDRERTNILTADFVSPGHDWSRQPADAWRDEGSIALHGEKPAAVDLTWVPSHAQARRLLKRFFARAAASHHGTVTADLEGLNALERRYIRLGRASGPLSMRDAAVEIVRARVDLMNGRVPLDLIRADPNIDAWNAATEEGSGPPLSARAPRIWSPTAELLSAEREADGGLMRLRLTVTDPGRPGLLLSARTRPTGGVSWSEENPQETAPGGGGLQILTGPVEAVALDVQCAFWSGGEPGEWSDTLAVAADVNPVEAALAAAWAAMSVQPNATFRNAQRALVTALMEDGLWSKIHHLSGLGHDQQSALINFKTPGTWNAAVNGGLAWSGGTFTGDGSDDWINLGFPMTALPGYSVNSTHVGVWVDAGVDADNYVFGTTANGRTILRPRGTNGNMTGALGPSGFSAVNFGAVPERAGYYIASRTNGSVVSGYRNGALVGSPSQASSGHTADNLAVLRSGALYSQDSVSIIHVGSGLTGSDPAALHAAFAAYRLAVGLA